MSPGEFAERVVAYCLATNASVTSWVKTVARNDLVGGALGSLHRSGLAVDVVYDKPVEISITDRMARYLGLVVIHEGDHDHLQPQG